MDKLDPPPIMLVTDHGRPVSSAPPKRRRGRPRKNPDDPKWLRPPAECVTKADRLELERQEELARRAAIKAAKRATHQADNVARAKTRRADKMRGWQPSSQQRRAISVAAAAGLNQEQIAGAIGVRHETLSKHCRKELADGAAMINAKVASKLFTKCMRGDTIALIFWAKARLGWQDRPSRLEVTGKDGGPIQHETLQAEADAFTARIASMADRFAGMMASTADETPPANDEVSPAKAE